MTGGRSCAGVVLAAGSGQRMGRPKALMEVDGGPLVHQAVRTLRDGGCDPVGVVVGAEASAVADRLTGQPVEVVRNDRFTTGMGSSVRRALDWAGSAPDVGALVILPVDTPGIGSQVIRRLVGRWQETPHRALVATYGGRPRNPVLLPAIMWPDVAASVRGDAGARGWLRDNPDLVTSVDCTDLGDPTDLDTPDDLARWHDRRDADAVAPTPGDAHGA